MFEASFVNVDTLEKDSAAEADMTFENVKPKTKIELKDNKKGI